MARIVYKPNRDKNEYVMWSTVVDNVIGPVMTRDEMFTELSTPNMFFIAHPVYAAQKLDDADATGSSCPDWLGETWDTEEIARNIDVDGVPEVGTIHVRDLAEFTRAQEAKDADRLNQLLTPLDTEEDE